MEKKDMIAKMNTKTGLLFAMVGIVLLSSCSGGGGTSIATPSSLPPVIVSTPGPSVATVPVTVKTIFAASTTSPASSSRQPKFVSPSTNGAKLIVYPHGSATAQGTYVYDLSPGSGLCTGSAPRVCTFIIQAPAGNLDFDLEIYDQAPVAGFIPGGAQHLGTSVLTQTINQNSGNSVTFAISGIPTSISLSTIAGPLTYASEAADGGTHTLAVTAAVKDASGNIISGTNPYTSPISVSLAESGGSGHSVLMINGVASGAAGSLVSPTTSLAVKYDGLGSPGYTTTLNVGAVSAIISPLYVSPSSITIHAANGSPSVALTEAGAPGAIAYSATTSCVEVTGTPTVGSGASATTNITTTSPGGTNDSCSLTIKDVLGTQVVVPLTIATYGPATSPGAPVLSSGVTGSCATSIAFTASGQTAMITMSDPGFSGTYVLGVPSPAVATASTTGSTVTITAASPGSETIGISDGFGNTFSCPIGVTTTSGSVN